MNSNTSGTDNSVLGSFALYSSTLGNANTAMGYEALKQATGSSNIAIGAGAGSSATTGNFNIYIGHPGLAGEANTLRVGDSNQQRAHISGVRGITTVANDAVNVVIDSNGQLGTISSTRDGKDDIADMSDASAALMQLRPVTFHYKVDHDPAGRRLQYGLIAEEVAEVYPGVVVHKDGKPETVMYQYLAPMLLNEFQKQQRTIESQAKEIADLKRAVEVLLARTATHNRTAAR